MIKIVAAAAIICSLASCMKGTETETGGSDYKPYVAIERDTIRSGGQMWGINVGESALDIYETIQAIRADKQIGYLAIIGNVFTDLSQVENRIPLYNSMLMDETTGTPTGVQLAFEASKIKAIYMNNGTPLSKWPSINDFQNGLSIGDSIKTIHSKLVQIKGLSVYGAKLQRISLFDKNLSTVFDDNMANSAQWQVVTAAIANRWKLLELNFSGGTLTSIYYTLYENK